MHEMTEIMNSAKNKGKALLDIIENKQNDKKIEGM